MSEQPQKEHDPIYHIRESELKYILSHNMEDDNSGLELVIRSRTHEELRYFTSPHTTPPASDPEKISVCGIFGDIDRCQKPEVKTACPLYEYCLKYYRHSEELLIQRDQAVKTEREKVLVELLDISHGVWNLPDMQNRMRAMREFLRSTRDD
jgi:hypothetical protein